MRTKRDDKVWSFRVSVVRGPLVVASAVPVERWADPYDPKRPTLMAAGKTVRAALDALGEEVETYLAEVSRG